MPRPGVGLGWLLGTGLGQGNPQLTYFAESDFIIPSFGEELGLVGAGLLIAMNPSSGSEVDESIIEPTRSLARPANGSVGAECRFW